MRKFLLISVVVLSASAAHAGLDVTAANTDPRPPEATRQTQPSSARRPDLLDPRAVLGAVKGAAWQR